MILLNLLLPLLVMLNGDDAGDNVKSMGKVVGSVRIKLLVW